MARNTSSPSLPSAHHLWLPLSLLLLLALFSTPSFSSAAKISYADHCSSVVPESKATSLFVDSYSSFYISNGYFSGGGNLFHSKLTSNSSSLPFFYFSAKCLHKTRSPGILQVDGTLVLRGAQAPIMFNNSMLYRHHSRGNFTTAEEASFDFSGFWSESTGKLCMVGHGVFDQPRGKPLHLSAVLKLNYPKTSNISTSLVRGTVKSLSSPNHFDPISLLAYASKKYDFTMIPQANSSCSSLHFEEKSVGFDPSSTCNYLQYMAHRKFKLDRMSGCSGSNCTTFGFSPRFISFNMVQCSEDGKLHLYIEFSNSSSHAYDNPMIPEKSLVGEGYWDHDKNHLCLIACRILQENSQTISSVGDCSIRLSLWFPAVMTLRSRSNIVGRIWSDKNKSDTSYFSMVSFRQTVMVPGLKYEYTEMDSVRKSCTAIRGRKSSEKTYPDGRSDGNMQLVVSLKDAGGRRGWGHANMLSIGDMFYGDGNFAMVSETISSPPAVNRVEMNHRIWNVSYAINYRLSSASSNEDERIDIAAEGIYDTGSGILCMKGCRYPSSPVVKGQRADMDSDSIDCQILINIQLRPLNPKAGDHTNGTISSTRNKLDSLYFDPIEVSSHHHIYESEATNSIWRMDVEIAMVLISLTFSCICIGLQIFHFKKHPDALPSISITMLFVLILGYMIPLVLNFEALFVNEKQYNVFLRSGAWLDVNEVVVRVISMVALFLSFRLLQAAWSARSSEESKRHCIAERTSLKLCLPLYFAGALLTWFMNSSPHASQLQRSEFGYQQHHSRWEDLISYAGLVLDGFLLPQIVLNVCQNSKDKVLTPFFYVGITVTRALPHLYDAYRTHRYVPYVNSSYIYASRDRDFYSLVWDIIIPCEGLLFVALIYLQQRFGGSCLLPGARKFVGYEAVPVVGL